MVKMENFAVLFCHNTKCKNHVANQLNTQFSGEHILTYPSLSCLKPLAVIQADVFTHTVFLLRNLTVSVNLRHENLKEGPLILRSVNSTLFLLDKIESIKQIFPRHLLCVWHYARDRRDMSKQKMTAYAVIQASVPSSFGSALEETTIRLGEPA